MKIAERLMAQAQQVSAIHRDIAEAKSMRQEGNHEGRKDLYSWAAPEETLEGQAAALLNQAEAALEEARRLCDATKIDLASAHAEICKLQKIDPETHSWPEWTSPANTLRWIDGKLIPQIDTTLASIRNGGSNAPE